MNFHFCRNRLRYRCSAGWWKKGLGIFWRLFTVLNKIPSKGNKTLYFYRRRVVRQSASPEMRQGNTKMYCYSISTPAIYCTLLIDLGWFAAVSIAGCHLSVFILRKKKSPDRRLIRFKTDHGEDDWHISPHPPQKKKKILSPSTTLIRHIIVFRRYILGKLPFSNQVTTTCSHDVYKVLINRQQEPITLLSTNQFRLNLNFKGTFSLSVKYIVLP